MNVKSLVLLTLILTAGCATTVSNTVQTAYDPSGDISRFLAAESSLEEDAILRRLEDNKVAHGIIKSILRSLPGEAHGPRGLLPNQRMSVKGQDYSYALHAPETAPGKNPPLIIVLHGMGGSGESTLPAWKERLGDEFIIACPSYPMGAWWSRNAEDFVLQLARTLRSQYAVDPDRVFLAGLSNGAIGSYMIGMNHPDRFAGILAIAGSITERYMHFLVNLRNTPIYLIQGRHDPIFPIEFSRRIFKILGDMKYPVIYREHEEKGTAHGGHFLPESEVPEMVRWLREQKRQTRPDIVRMTREQNHLGRIAWARVSKGDRLAALQIPGPEKEPVNIKDGNVATLFATNTGNNSIEVMAQNVAEYEIYLDDDSVDFNRPVRITTQDIVTDQQRVVAGEKRVGFFGKVRKDREVLLREFKSTRDPRFLFDAKVVIAARENMEIARLP